MATKDFDIHLPKLPRPDVNMVPSGAVFGVQRTFHPVLSRPRESETLDRIIQRIQKFAYMEGVRITEFFKDYDRTRCGRVTENIFRRCLDMMDVGEAGTRRYNLSQEQMNKLVDAYRDPLDPSICLWRLFEEDIEAIFTKKGLEKLPEYVVQSPLSSLLEIPQRGNVYRGLPKQSKELFSNVFQLVKDQIFKYRLNLLPFFYDFNKCRIKYRYRHDFRKGIRSRFGYVTRNQFQQVLMMNNILLSDEQCHALEQRYVDEYGFNYLLFLKEADPMPEFQCDQKLGKKQIQPPEIYNSLERAN